MKALTTIALLILVSIYTAKGQAKQSKERDYFISFSYIDLNGNFNTANAIVSTYFIPNSKDLRLLASNIGRIDTTTIVILSFQQLNPGYLKTFFSEKSHIKKFTKSGYDYTINP